MTLSCHRNGSTDIYTVQIFVNKQKCDRDTKRIFLVLDYLKDRGKLSVQPDDELSQFIKTAGGVTFNAVLTRVRRLYVLVVVLQV
jgi:hypothetical protein